MTGPKRGFNPPLHQWLNQEPLVSLAQDLPKILEQLTDGQLVAKPLIALMQEAKKHSNLDEIMWMLMTLQLSLEQLKEFTAKKSLN